MNLNRFTAHERMQFLYAGGDVLQKLEDQSCTEGMRLFTACADLDNGEASVQFIYPSAEEQYHVRALSYRRHDGMGVRVWITARALGVGRPRLVFRRRGLVDDVVRRAVDALHESGAPHVAEAAPRREARLATYGPGYA